MVGFIIFLATFIVVLALIILESKIPSFLRKPKSNIDKALQLKKEAEELEAEYNNKIIEMLTVKELAKTNLEWILGEDSPYNIQRERKI